MSKLYFFTLSVIYLAVAALTLSGTLSLFNGHLPLGLGPGLALTFVFFEFSLP